MSTCLLITTCDRTELLARNLRRLSLLTLPDEILVVDDGGTDPTTFELCKVYEEDLCLPIRYLYTHNPGQTMCSHARNVGINSTACDVVVTCEPEMLFDTDVVAQLLADHRDRPYSEAINVGTVHHEQAPGTGPCCCCGQEKHTTVNWEAPWIALYERKWLLDLGGWDESFPDPWGWDDTDLLTRLRIYGVGKYNDLAIEATHQWHPSQALPQTPNEAHFTSKGFNGDERRDHPELVANRAAILDGSWGAPRSRPA